MAVFTAKLAATRNVSRGMIGLGDMSHGDAEGGRLTPTPSCCRRTESLNLALAFLALRVFG